MFQKFKWFTHLAIAPAKLAWIALGSAFISFGLVNVHQQADLTEGGVLGLTLLLNHWLGLSPSVLSLFLDLICYLLAFRFLGKSFIKISIVASIWLAGFLQVWERIPPMLSQISSYPWIAAPLGGLFIGIGVGLVVRQGGSSGGDDALALILSKVSRVRLSIAYLATDLTVLLLSLSYIPLDRIAYSLLTVVVSSLTIDFVQNAGRNEQADPAKDKKLWTARKADAK
ncbi:YitT family protein [Paenibacillus soyae]|uniref:YitT family protein n=1 Tax=Paenibacillus soyae TaxID=2969249 RepID=A0A9X2MLH9_9BACL|nr:YitT family protein [Paenibacillus soyae]MCR2802304.1 YitT family protein [Paenibacillus soyae]